MAHFLAGKTIPYIGMLESKRFMKNPVHRLCFSRMATSQERVFGVIEFLASNANNDLRNRLSPITFLTRKK